VACGVRGVRGVRGVCGSLMYAFDRHELLAELNWAGGDYVWAMTHYAYAELPGTVVTKIMTLPKAAQRDMLLCTAGLTFLCLENMRDANKMMIQFKIALGSGEAGRPVFLVAWLLEICKKDATQLFQWLLSSFKKEVEAMPAWGALLNTVGKKYFNVQAPPNMLSMLEGMLGGGGGGGGGGNPMAALMSGMAGGR